MAWDDKLVGDSHWRAVEAWNDRRGLGSRVDPKTKRAAGEPPRALQQ